VSRGGASGDRLDWNPAPSAAAPPVENVGGAPSALPADRRLGGRPEADPRLVSRLGRVRHTDFVRERKYRTSPAEQWLLTTVGAFRAVAVDDLVRFQYSGDHRQVAHDLRNLKGQDLVRVPSFMVGTGENILQVVVLTRKAKALLDALGTRDGRQISHVGLVKPREIAHDAALYRMYQAEATAIRNQGGTVRRVILDYELKATLYTTLAKALCLPRIDRAQVQKEIALANDLPVAGGRILLPDLRLEYETAEGDLTKVDLELATPHYHGAYAFEKASVGFKLYADGPSAARLNARLTEGRAPVPEGPGLTDAILSL
jgi:hypothetical protein